MSNLTNRAVTPKGARKPKGNQPTAADRKRWELIRALGCSVHGCGQPPAIHHAETGRGGRKNHKKVFPICAMHHTGFFGIHKMGRIEWQKRYGTEQFHLERVKRLLGES